MRSDISGTITTGGAAQALMPANSNSAGFCVQNLDATTNLYINTMGTASAGVGSIVIPPYGLYETPFTGVAAAEYGTVSIFSTKTGHAFTARRW